MQMLYVMVIVNNVILIGKIGYLAIYIILQLL